MCKFLLPTCPESTKHFVHQWSRAGLAPRRHSNTLVHPNSLFFFFFSINARSLVHPLALFSCFHYPTCSTVFLGMYGLACSIVLPSSSFCNPYRHCSDPNIFLIVMSALVCIDWSCPMRKALYLYSHNPQAQPAKILVQTQRTHESHSMKKKRFQNGPSRPESKA